eukprot:TRINITY_DN1181_c0_g1_i1.p1 TRINITY_DN1181_c0_g1~~TRINITY_DN1181_c0_g1_i1.p1  ORF type:complete len:479 (+),score=207.48 TRINITY_DN1181_c0_g1_i1:110-1546(+)
MAGRKGAAGGGAAAAPEAKAGAVAKMLGTQRAIPDVAPPIWEPIARNKCFDGKGLPILPNLKQHFLAEGLLGQREAIDLCTKASAVLRKEPNLLRLNDPITVCGDIHGQLYDLMKLFEIGGDPSEQQYLFLGDFVDRGCFGCEVAFYMFAAKVRHPDTFYMLRGNHECRHLTAYFNFKAETLYKYNQEIYDAIQNTFDCLPIACVLNGRFLCVHGGLSPDVRSVDDINSIHRFREPPSSGPLCDLIWSDPMDEEEEEYTPEALYVHNDLRGCSYVFSYNAVCQFLVNNNLLSVIRAHEAQDEGYRLYKKSSTGFPSVICIFSAPNYCDSYDNKAAIIRFQNNLMNIRQFNSSPHPYYLPNFMNAFSWSMPFVAEKVTDMLITIWGLVDEPADGEGPEDEERGAQLKNKIIAMGKMARIFKTLREENESVVALKGLAGGQVPVGMLAQGGKDLKESIQGFQGSRKVDAMNERRPQFSTG